MNVEIDSAIRTHVTGLKLGHFELMSDCYSFPLPIYHDGDILVLKSKEDLHHFLNLYRTMALCKPIADVESTVLDDAIIDANRRRLTIEWRMRYDDGEIRRNIATRYLQKIGADLKVAMVEKHQFDFGGPFESLQCAFAAKGVTLQ